MNLGNILGSQNSNNEFLNNLKASLEKAILQHEQQKMQNKNDADAKENQNEANLRNSVEGIKQAVENQQKIQKNNEILAAAAKGKINAGNNNSGAVQTRI